LAIQRTNYRLHSHVSMIFLIVAIASLVAYLLFIVVVVNKMEDAMLGTLIGHEADELLTELALDPEAKMPRTASVNAYLRSRSRLDPIPDYLGTLQPNVYNEIPVGENTYQALILDINDDRLYLAFDTTGISQHRSTLLFLLAGGGLISTIVLVISGIWLFRQFFLPVSRLAEEVANLNPSDRKVPIQAKFRHYEVGLIAQAIDEFMGRLDEYVEREQSFTAAISHELRTPISVIVTATDLLELKGIADKQKGAFDRIKSSTSYMSKVIETLLFFARNTLDTVEKTVPVINPNEIFLNILKQYEEQASKKKLVLLYKKKSSIKVRMSENHLEIVLGNLIRNAIDHTDNGEIKVTLFDNGFSVEDTGAGIEADEINLIVKLSYHSADSRGCGLGLYLVTNICNIYGLRLEIESEVGDGSKFSIIFPEDIIS
jgi:signal transduction histidine kinase